MENMFYDEKFNWKLWAVKKALKSNKNFKVKPRIKNMKLYWHFSLHHVDYGYVGAVDCLGANYGGDDIKKEVDVYKRVSQYFCIIELFPSIHSGKNIPNSWIKKYVGVHDEDEPFVWMVRTSQELKRGLKDLHESYETKQTNSYVTRRDSDMAVSFEHLIRGESGKEFSLGKANFYKTGGKLVICYSGELEDQESIGKFFKIKNSSKNIKFKKDLGKMKRTFSNLRESKMRI